MSFSDYMLAVPPPIRLLLALIVVVGTAVGLTNAFHPRIVRFVQGPPASDNPEAGSGAQGTADGESEARAGEPSPPPVEYLGGRLISLSTFAFVFLLGFAISQFWGVSKDASHAAMNEAQDFARAVALARSLPDPLADPLLAAFEDYRVSVVAEEWPLLQQADRVAVRQLRLAASDSLSQAVAAAQRSGAEDDAAWSALTGKVDDLLTDSLDRADDLPGQMATGVIWLVITLGLLNLAFVVAFQPTKLRANLIIVGLMAALTTLMLFVMVELANPYLGAGAVVSPLAQ